jgi:hypothetical protein
MEDTELASSAIVAFAVTVFVTDDFVNDAVALLPRTSLSAP